MLSSSDALALRTVMQEENVPTTDCSPTIIDIIQELQKVPIEKRLRKLRQILQYIPGLQADQIYKAALQKHPVTQPLTQSQMRKLASFPLTDMGNAEAFVYLLSDVVQFDAVKRQWYIWEDVWRPSDKIMLLAKKVVRLRQQSFRTFAEGVSVEELRRQLRWGTRSEDKSRLNSMISLAQADLTTTTKWDLAPTLLGTQNGTVDLNTGRLQPGSFTTSVSKRTSCDFVPTATCPHFLNFMEDIFPNQIIRRYVQKIFGYCLTGFTNEQKVFIAHGGGSNGKSALLTLMSRIFGEYSKFTTSAAFAQKYGAQTQSDLVRLQGVRMAIAAETSACATLSTHTLKAITGGEDLAVRELYRPVTQYTPMFKLWLPTNHDSTLRDVSYAMRRRIIVIPFERTFRREAIPDIARRLYDIEAEGILAWVIKGTQMWKNERLAPPSPVVKSTQNWLYTHGSLSAFIDTCCVLSGQVSAESFRIAYYKWCQPDLMPIARGNIDKMVSRLGVTITRDKGRKMYTGLRVLNMHEIIEGVMDS